MSAAAANASEQSQSGVQVVRVDLPNEFRSTQHKSFFADVTTVSHFNTEWKIQVVFKGYLRDDHEILYEFLHEQCWITSEGAGESTNKVELDVRIRRLPPSMSITEKLRIEYMVQVNADAWYTNAHFQRIFAVIRDDQIKELNHLYPTKYNVNECVGHNECCHRNCEALNGKFWIDGIVYHPGQRVDIRWKIKSETALREATIVLYKNISLRHPNSEHPMDINIIQKEAAVNKESVSTHTEGISLVVPQDLPITHKSTIWDTTKLHYFVGFSLKMDKIKETLDLNFPITIEHQNRNSKQKNQQMTEAEHDMYDVKDGPSKQVVPPQPQTLVVNNIELYTSQHQTLEGARVILNLTVRQAQRYTIHFLLQGSVCTGGKWYEFLRYKTNIVKDHLNVGPFQNEIQIPFDRSQYLTLILPPSFNDEVRYECLLSTRDWTDNRLIARKIVLVDRETETLCKAEMLTEYYEEKGAIKLYMRQRAFKRGKYVIVQVEGKVSALSLMLVQHKRIRKPGLELEGCFFKEKVVCSMDSSPDRRDWPKEWSLRIPDRITPSIDTCYWNVLAVEYKVVVKLNGHDRHQHVHVIPIWIGTTDDEMDPPSNELLESYGEGPQGQIRHNPTKMAPEFEVIPNEHDQPWWVDRLDFDVYVPATEPKKEPKKETKSPKKPATR
ncbi:hypothetical protein FO519_005113 [Halicephalobus sp. NKZ332]|nr:hypothetical protein FO519_005113 [Halicephalobus sp. NKZ332]